MLIEKITDTLHHEGLKLFERCRQREVIDACNAALCAEGKIRVECIASQEALFDVRAELTKQARRNWRDIHVLETLFSNNTAKLHLGKHQGFLLAGALVDGRTGELRGALAGALI
jgi:hypothetical protein